MGRPPSALILALLSLPAACRHGDRAGRVIEVGRIQVSWVEVVDATTVERDEKREAKVRGILEQKIASHPRIEHGIAGRDPLELAVVSGKRDPGSTEGGDEITTFTLRTTWADGWRLSSSILTELPDGDATKAGLVLDDLIEDLVLQMDLFGLDDGRLVGMVRDRDCAIDGVCSTAVRILGERRSAVAVPALVAKLEKARPEDPIFEDIVGALGRIGDQRATPALITAFSGADPPQQVTIVGAVGTCGGPEARPFLEVMASGHESPIIRMTASRMLDSMDKKIPAE